MPVGKDHVRQELFDLFGESLKFSPYFEDYVTIGSFLSDPSQYGAPLRLLELAMTQELNRRIRLASSGAILSDLEVDIQRDALIVGCHDGTLSAAAQKVYFSKLLTKALEDFERNAAFCLGESDQIDVSGPADILLGNPTRKFNQ